MDKYIHTDVWRGCLKDIAARLRDKANWQRSFTNDNHAGGIAADALDETALSIEEAIAPKLKADSQINQTEAEHPRVTGADFTNRY